MNTQTQVNIEIGEWCVIRGIERNRPVRIVRVDLAREIAWVRMPEGDLLDVDFCDLSSPEAK